MSTNGGDADNYASAQNSTTYRRAGTTDDHSAVGKASSKTRQGGAKYSTNSNSRHPSNQISPRGSAIGPDKDEQFRVTYASGHGGADKSPFKNATASTKNGAGHATARVQDKGKAPATANNGSGSGTTGKQAIAAADDAKSRTIGHYVVGKFSVLFELSFQFSRHHS